MRASILLPLAFCIMLIYLTSEVSSKRHKSQRHTTKRPKTTHARSHRHKSHRHTTKSRRTTHAPKHTTIKRTHRHKSQRHTSRRKTTRRYSTGTPIAPLKDCIVSGKKIYFLIFYVMTQQERFNTTFAAITFCFF